MFGNRNYIVHRFGVFVITTAVQPEWFYPTQNSFFCVVHIFKDGDTTCVLLILELIIKYFCLNCHIYNLKRIFKINVGIF